jgi:hypothetical protein
MMRPFKQSNYNKPYRLKALSYTRKQDFQSGASGRSTNRIRRLRLL